MEETTYELNDLLDCPFCGERPTMHHLSHTFSNLEMYWVICPCCSATIKNVAITEELAKQVWNRRTILVDEIKRKNFKVTDLFKRFTDDIKTLMGETSVQEQKEDEVG